MLRSQLVSNPFSLLMNPQAVLDAMEKSERLGQLASRICRPLDKIPGAAPEADVAEAAEAGESDEAAHTYLADAPLRPF